MEQKKNYRRSDTGLSPISDPGRKERGHRGEIPPGRPCFSSLYRRNASREGAGYPLQKPSAGRKLCGAVHQFHAGQREQLPDFHGLARLQDEIPQSAAAGLLCGGKGADKGRVRAAFKSGREERAASAGDGDHLLHRHPRVRTEIFYSGSGEARGGYCALQGQDPDDPASRQAETAAAGLCRKTENPLRRDLSHGARKTSESESHMGADERAVQSRRGKAGQGLSP